MPGLCVRVGESRDCARTSMHCPCSMVASRACVWLWHLTATPPVPCLSPDPQQQVTHVEAGVPAADLGHRCCCLTHAKQALLHILSAAFGFLVYVFSTGSSQQQQQQARYTAVVSSGGEIIPVNPLLRPQTPTWPPRCVHSGVVTGLILSSLPTSFPASNTSVPRNPPKHTPTPPQKMILKNQGDPQSPLHPPPLGAQQGGRWSYIPASQHLHTPAPPSNHLTPQPPNPQNPPPLCAQQGGRWSHTSPSGHQPALTPSC